MYKHQKSNQEKHSTSLEKSSGPIKSFNVKIITVIVRSLDHTILWKGDFLD